MFIPDFARGVQCYQSHGASRLVIGSMVRAIGLALSR